MAQEQSYHAVCYSTSRHEQSLRSCDMLGLGLSMSPNLSKDCDCILCSQPAQFVPGTDPIPFDCPRCGRFKITFDSMANLGSCEKQCPALSDAPRESSERGKWLTISLGIYEALADQHRWTSVQQKSLKLLEWIRTRSSSFKHEVPLDPATVTRNFATRAEVFPQRTCCWSNLGETRPHPRAAISRLIGSRSEEHTSEFQS